MYKCIQATNNNVDDVIRKGIVFTVFWATWNRKCKIISPIIEELAKDFKDKITIIEVNTDDLQETVMRFKIKVVPTILILKDGKEMSRTSREYSKESFVKMINKAIKETR